MNKIKTGLCQRRYIFYKRVQKLYGNFSPLQTCWYKNSVHYIFMQAKNAVLPAYKCNGQNYFTSMLVGG